MPEAEIDKEAVPLSIGSSRCLLLMTYQRKETAMTVDRIAQKRSSIKPDTLVVGIDLAKHTHVARARFSDGSYTRPVKVPNNRAGFLALSEQIGAWKARPDSAVIVGVESTGSYGVNLVRWLAEYGCRVVLVPSLHVCREKELLDNGRGTSDDKDALIIADLIARGQYLGFVTLSDACLELRPLVSLRTRLVREQTGWLNALHQTMDVLFPEFETVFAGLSRPNVRVVLGRFGTVAAARAHSPTEMRRLLARDGAVRLSMAKLRRLKAAAAESIGPLEVSASQERSLREMLETLSTLEARIAGLEAEIVRLLEQLPESEYLMSVKGVGAMTAAVILAETGGLAQYSCASAVLKLAGLNLYQVSSGQYQSGRHISKRGRSQLRRALYMVAVQHAKRGWPLEPYYTALVARGKPKTVALTAVCCRLVRLLYALVRDGRCYRECPPEAGRPQAA
jgi:transposase